MGYDTDGSSEFDLPGLESLAGRSQPFSTQAESVDLLGVEPTLVDLEQVSSVPAASAAPASAATPDQPASLVPADLPAVPLPPPAEAPVDVPSDEEDLPPWAWGPGMDLDPVFVPAPADPGVQIHLPLGQPCLLLCRLVNLRLGRQLWALFRAWVVAGNVVPAGDVAAHLPETLQVWPIRYPLHSLPTDLVRHGHRLSGFCCTPSWGGCQFSCSRPVSGTARKPHRNHFCDRCR